MDIFSPTFKRVILLWSLLLLGSISFSTQAWEGDKRAPWVGKSISGEPCQGGQVPFGPFDYRQRAVLPGQLEVVEETHFTPNIETLQSGNTTTAMGDIHYTLQTWPNHHRALNSAVRFRLQHKELWKAKNSVLSFPAECYLQRAIKFSPTDPVPYVLYGMLMHKMKVYGKALEAYRSAVRLQPNEIITQYNMALTLVELKKYPEARLIAHKVYAKNFPLPGLKNKLVQAGEWENNKQATPQEAKTPVVEKPEAGKPEAEISEAVQVETTTSEAEVVVTEPQAPDNADTATKMAESPTASVQPLEQKQGMLDNTDAGNTAASETTP